jgi:hypothetical protein
MLNAYIKSIGPSPASVRERAQLYGEFSSPFSNDPPLPKRYGEQAIDH